ncbi:MAG: DUF3788 domain-containing protein [Acidobacteriia bacterium]|nr:DUF3788 domain-containing protein [Terriglobia bacterium]
MSPSFFLDKQQPPSAKALSLVLGKPGTLWNEIKAHVASQYEPIVEAWGYAGKQYGWSLGLKQRKRSILYLIPGEGGFVCSLAFSEKAVAEARTRSLPAGVMKTIDEAKRFAEGRAVRLEIKSSKDVAIVKQLVDIKMSSI